MGTYAPMSEMELIAQQPAFHLAVPLGRRGKPAGSNFPTKISAFHSLPSLSHFRSQSRGNYLEE